MEVKGQNSSAVPMEATGQLTHLDVPDEGHGDAFFKLVQRCVEVQDFHNLQIRDTKL